MFLQATSSLPIMTCARGAVLSLALLAAALPAIAQNTMAQTNAAPATPPAASMPMPDDEQGWREQYGERRDIREERNALRHEHDTLEAEHESLRIECIDAKGQDHVQCQQKWADLHQRRDALMARLHALHERACAEAHHPQPNCAALQHAQAIPVAPPAGQ